MSSFTFTNIIHNKSAFVGVAGKLSMKRFLFKFDLFQPLI